MSAPSEFCPHGVWVWIHLWVWNSCCVTALKCEIRERSAGEKTLRNAAKPSAEAHDQAVCRNAADWLAGIVLMACVLSAKIRRRRRLLSQNRINEMLKIMVGVSVYLILC